MADYNKGYSLNIPKNLSSPNYSFSSNYSGYYDDSVFLTSSTSYSSSYGNLRVPRELQSLNSIFSGSGSGKSSVNSGSGSFGSNGSFLGKVGSSIIDRYKSAISNLFSSSSSSASTNTSYSSGSSSAKISNDAQFSDMMKFIAKWEGGYSDHPADKGGATNKGITTATYNSYRQSKGLPAQHVKNISDTEVQEIYYKNYYQASGADKIADKRLAMAVFNTAVNMGVGRAKEFLSKSGGDVNKYVQLIENKYSSIIANNPSQAVFKNGWANRTNDLKSIIGLV